MMNLNDLNTFAMVAKLGTFSEAAHQLDVPKSTVSRRIARLEDDLGVELFTRSARRIVLTQDGRGFYDRIAGLLEGIHDAERALQDNTAEPEGILRITTTEGYGQTPAVLECLSAYLAKYPKVNIDLQLTSRVVDLVEDQIDVGFRLYRGQLPGDANTMSRKLHEVRSGLFVSPEYLVTNAQLKELTDLRAHRYVAFGLVTRTALSWWMDDVEMDIGAWFPEPVMTVNNTATLTHCALMGMGVCILDEMSAQRFVDQGLLVRVLPQLSQQIAKVSLVWPASRHLSMKTRSFINHAVTCLKVP